MKLFSWYTRHQLPADVGAALLGLVVGAVVVQLLWGKL